MKKIIFIVFIVITTSIVIFVTKNNINSHNVVENNLTNKTPNQNTKVVSPEPYIPDYEDRNMIKNEEEEVEYIKDITKVSMTLKEGSITDKGLILIIKDENEQKYNHYSDTIIVEKYENENWIEVDVKDRTRTAEGILYEFNENNEIENQIDWQRKYGILENGNYKLKVNIDDNWFELEFEIKEI